MPKLPVIRDRDLIRVLKKLGFVEARQQGTSHLILKHPDGRMASVRFIRAATSLAEPWRGYYGPSGFNLANWQVSYRGQ